MSEQKDQGMQGGLSLLRPTTSEATRHIDVLENRTLIKKSLIDLYKLPNQDTPEGKKLLAQQAVIKVFDPVWGSRPTVEGYMAPNQGIPNKGSVSHLIVRGDQVFAGVSDQHVEDFAVLGSSGLQDAYRVTLEKGFILGSKDFKKAAIRSKMDDPTGIQYNYVKNCVIYQLEPFVGEISDSIFVQSEALYKKNIKNLRIKNSYILDPIDGTYRHVPYAEFPLSSNWREQFKQVA
jgi:hypothetical protein